MADKSPKPNNKRNRDKSDEVSRKYNYKPRSQNWVLFIALAILLLLGLWLYVFRYNNKESEGQNQQQNGQEELQSVNDQFRPETKSANFVRSIPQHEENIPAPPVNIYIVTNSASSVDGTQVRITSGNQDYGTGDTLIGQNGTTLRKNMDSNAPDGLYTVNYRSCGQDRHCQIGSFQFKVDRNKANDYTDLRNKDSVTVSIANADLNPKNIRISRGTKVNWTNNNSKPFVIISGTDETRTYFANLTSNPIPVNSNFSFTFNTGGYIPYRSISEDQTINGSIIVE